ncbi:hypothetical protein F5Y04DRAFT_271383 [Hypomontagnella monticulosa]|nr:hypothetical protein F5Y04DRAFT_271383 [Hypomontagnella monticulosa]
MTLEEYIAGFHDIIFSKFAIQSNPDLQSKGSIPAPTDKICPRHLKQWSDFIPKQRHALANLYEIIPMNEQVYSPRAHLTGMGHIVGSRPIADEKSLESFMHGAVEYPVATIINKLKDMQGVTDKFNLGGGIDFENHPHALKVAARNQPPQTPSNGRLRPDQICPPHKLTRLQLQSALREMDMMETVVNRQTIPPTQKTEERFKYFADRLTASALTQTYNYMIQCGLEYGLLTTGEAIVFLKVDCEEVKVHEKDGYHCTAVSQYLAFSLMVFGPPGAGTPIHTQDERADAKAGADRWCVDFTSTHRSIPPADSTPPSPTWSAKSYHPSIDKEVPRSPWPRRRPLQDVLDRHLPRNDTRSESSEDDWCPDTPSLEPRTLRSGVSYGLVNGAPLDERCPNAALHRRAEAGKHHPISYDEFVQLMYNQLETSLDDGVKLLYLGGATGILFRIMLLVYGYTFVGKGTIEGFIPTLQRKEAMYKHLNQNQGLDIPVYLGSMDLRSMNKIYYYDFRVYVVYIVLMSWGGVAIDSSVDIDKVRGCLHAIHNNGVAHRDVRRWNVLSDPRTGQVMIVDFERASFVKLARPPLAQVVCNKQPRDGGRHEPKSRGRTVVQHDMFAEDIAKVGVMFSAA